MIPKRGTKEMRKFAWLIMLVPILLLAIAASASARTLMGSRTLPRRPPGHRQHAAVGARGRSDARAQCRHNNAGVAQRSPIPTGSGTTSDIGFFVKAAPRPPSSTFGLYADSGGEPGALLTSGALSSPVSSAWNDVEASARRPSRPATPIGSRFSVREEHLHTRHLGRVRNELCRIQHRAERTPSGLCDRF